MTVSDDLLHFPRRWDAFFAVNVSLWRVLPAKGSRPLCNVVCMKMNLKHLVIFLLLSGVGCRSFHSEVASIPISIPITEGTARLELWHDRQSQMFLIDIPQGYLINHWPGGPPGQPLSHDVFQIGITNGTAQMGLFFSHSPTIYDMNAYAAAQRLNVMVFSQPAMDAVGYRIGEWHCSTNPPNCKTGFTHMWEITLTNVWDGPLQIVVSGSDTNEMQRLRRAAMSLRSDKSRQHQH